jgi:hypothetical protein
MFSITIRRLHMYLALFLVPWVLMYAISTLVMNHRDLFQEWYHHEPAEWTLEREMPYAATFSTDAKRWMVADQILRDLDLEGSHTARGRLDNQITIVRNHTVFPQRIIYTPKTQSLRIESLAFRTNAFLERMHRRRGYNQEFIADDIWAITVDLFILSTVLWAASGLWMWWELKVTRKWGAVGIASGIALFTFFLFTI